MRTVKSSFEELIGLGVPYYRFSDHYRDEATCIERDGDEWVVYYAERGGKSFPKRFSTESEACDYFVAAVKKYELGQS